MLISEFCGFNLFTQICFFKSPGLTATKIFTSHTKLDWLRIITLCTQSILLMYNCTAQIEIFFEKYFEFEL